MMTYHNGRYCVSARALIDGGIMTLGSYKYSVRHKRSSSEAEERKAPAH